MGRPGITYTDVANAAQQIAAQGNNPTIEAVRAVLKTGSSGTIAGHLREWKAKQSNTLAIASKEKLPEELVAVIKGLWNKLVTQSEQEINVFKESASQATDRLKDDLEKLQHENNQLQQQHHSLQNENKSLTHENETLQQVIASNKLEITTLQTKVDNFSNQLNEKQSRVEELHQLNQQIQQNLEHYRESSREQRAHDQHTFEQRQHQLQLTIQQHQQEIASLAEENKTLNQQNISNQQIVNDLREVGAAYKKAQSRMVELEKIVTKHQEAETHWKSRYDSENAKANKQQSELLELQQAQASLKQKLSDNEATIGELKSQNRVLANEKWEVGQEKASLLGQLKQLEAVGR